MRRTAVLPLLLLVASCSTDAIDGVPLPLAHAGPWAPSPEVMSYGNSISMPYDGPGPWDGGAHCGGGLLSGTRVLGDYLLAEFPAIDTYGGYSCRQNTANLAEMSVHGTGRALDLMISMDATDADNDAGDPVAAWLIMHAVEVGVQFLIWDHEDWGASRSVPKFRAYGGPIPHTDHIHMELTIEAAAMGTPWFTDRDGDGVPNDVDDCIDEADPLQTDTDHDGIGDVCDPTPGTTPDAGMSGADAGMATPDGGSTGADASTMPTGDAEVFGDDASAGGAHGRSVLRGGCGVAPGSGGTSVWIAVAIAVLCVVGRRRAHQ